MSRNRGWDNSPLLVSPSESTATRIYESGNGVRVRITKGYLQGYLATLDNLGRVWISGGLTHLTEEDAEPAEEGV